MTARPQGRLLHLGVEFARATSPLGLLLHGQAGEREIPYCFTVLRSAGAHHPGRRRVPDTGQGRELAAEDGITVWRDPAALLARAGPARGRGRDPGHPRSFRSSRERRGLPQRHRLHPAARGGEVGLGGQPAAPHGLAEAGGQHR